MEKEPLKIIDFMDRLIHCSLNQEFGLTGTTNMDVSSNGLKNCTSTMGDNVKKQIKKIVFFGPY